MSSITPSSESFKGYFASILEGAGYDTLTWELVEDLAPLVLAENPYYLIAFQVFDVWSELVDAAGQIELALSDIIGRQEATDKVWDAYLVLVCRTGLHKIEEFNQFSDLAYNTRRTRKIVRTGLGDQLTRLDEIARPFVSLTKARSSAKGRDPLRILGGKMIEDETTDHAEIEKLISIFRERGDLAGV